MEKNALLSCTHKGCIWTNKIDGAFFVGPQENEIVQVSAMKIYDQSLYFSLYEYNDNQWFNAKWFITTQSPLSIPEEIFFHSTEKGEL